MTTRARIVLSPWAKGEPINYRCSLCGQMFILPEDRSPKEGISEVWAAFNEHVNEVHFDGRTSGAEPYAPLSL